MILILIFIAKMIANEIILHQMISIIICLGGRVKSPEA